MSVRKVIILSIGCFLLGGIISFLLLKYFFPSWINVENTLADQKVYEVEHNDCPVEEEPAETECSIFVDISGAVSIPGVYCFNPGDRVIDAVKKAGGFSKNVALEYIEREINLSKVLTDSQKLYFPSHSELICNLKDFTLKTEEVIPKESTTGSATDKNEKDNSGGITGPSSCININSADITALDSLDGIGPSTAQKIIDNRPYNSTDDLLNVSGIGQTTYDKFKDNICI